MKVSVNGNAKEYDENEVSIIDLLKFEDVESPDMVSVQLNGSIVKRESFGTTSIQEDDEVEFLYFMGGGAYAWR